MACPECIVRLANETESCARPDALCGEIRDDLSPDLVTGVLDWLAERFQDAQVTDELDPGLFRRASAADQARRVDEFVELLRSAIGARAHDDGARGRRGPRQPGRSRSQVVTP